MEVELTFGSSDCVDTGVDDWRPTILGVILGKFEIGDGALVVDETGSASLDGEETGVFVSTEGGTEFRDDVFEDVRGVGVGGRNWFSHI